MVNRWPPEKGGKSIELAVFLCSFFCSLFLSSYLTLTINTIHHLCSRELDQRDAPNRPALKGRRRWVCICIRRKRPSNALVAQMCRISVLTWQQQKYIYIQKKQPMDTQKTLIHDIQCARSADEDADSNRCGRIFFLLIQHLNLLRQRSPSTSRSTSMQFES